MRNMLYDVSCFDLSPREQETLPNFYSRNAFYWYASQFFLLVPSVKLHFTGIFKALQKKKKMCLDIVHK